MTSRWLDPRLPERFWRKVDRSEGGCWLWLGAPTTGGYGRFSIHPCQQEYAHRVTYQALVGALTPGMHIDHLCRTRICVNPAHLEQVAPAENTRRGHAPTILLRREGRCIHGHKLTEENTYVRPDNGRHACLTCIRSRKSCGPRAKCLDCGRATRAFSGLCRPCITARRASNTPIPTIDASARLRSKGDS